MRIVVTGGGTAGHINPALAIAKFIKNKNPDCEIVYVGNKKHMEYHLVKSAGFEFIDVDVEGFQRKINFRNIYRNIKAIRLLFIANLKVKKILKKINPDLVIGTGGYVTGPVLNVAAGMGIRTFTHEQNAYPGVTTKLLSTKVEKVLLAVPEAKKHLSERCNAVVVGNPIRPEILLMNRDNARQKLKIDKDDVCVLSFGGSLGAYKVNEAIADLMSKTLADSKLHYIHATGKLGFENFEKMLRQRNLDIKNKQNVDIREYINNMDECMSAADIVICRSGAITLSELQACGKASILIPSPNVAENHQYYNAKVLVDNGAAILIEEKDLNANVIYEKVMDLVRCPDKISKIGENARRLAILDSCQKIYGIVMPNDNYCM